MSDILYDAAIEYQKLKKIIYRIVIGRKNKSYTIMLHFPPESFFHLAGLQHLTDITFPSKNKERIYKEILNKKISINDIKKSAFFEKWFIEERLENFYHLEKMLDSNAVTYLINSKRYISYTSIRADYLCERGIEKDIVYLFVVRQQTAPKFENECKGCSFFTKHEDDYTTGTAKTTTLLIEKSVAQNVSEVFRNPAYK